MSLADRQIRLEIALTETRTNAYSKPRNFKRGQNLRRDKRIASQKVETQQKYLQDAVRRDLVNQIIEPTSYPWSKNLRLEILERDNRRCVYCGKAGKSIDHVVSYARGGPTIRSNGVTSCHKCNTRKGGKADIIYFTRAFHHLISQGEDISWLDELWICLPELWNFDTP